MCFFGNTYSNGLDAYDAGKLTNLDENLALMVENSQQSIATFNDPTLTTIYPLSLSNYRHQNYVIKTELVNYDGLSPYLVDQFLGTTTALEHNGTYAFSLDPNQAASSAIDRFKIVFQNSALSAADFSKNIALFPNPAKAGESFYLQGISETANVTVYTVLGQKVPIEIQAQGQQLKVTPKTSVSQGIYLVNITSENQNTSIKWIIE